MILSIIVTVLLFDVNGAPQRKPGGNSCTNPSSISGTCLNINKCEPLRKLLHPFALNPQFRKYLMKSNCGWDYNDPMVCCPSKPDPFLMNLAGEHFGSQEESSSVTTSTTTRAPWTTRTTRTPWTTTAGSLSPRVHLNTLGVCGKSTGFHIRVVGGSNATLGAWPWMAALGYHRKNKKEPHFKCAGSLITDRLVLTAAHCINPNDLYMVRLGDLNLDDDNDGADPVDVRIEKQIVHEQYRPGTVVNDIAILKLERPVKLTDHIKPVCLPVEPEFRNSNYEGKTPYVAGWGDTEYHGPKSISLMEVRLPIVPEDECKKAYNEAKGAVIDKRVVCAGYKLGGKDSCGGDSGGPLMDFHDRQRAFYQIGVVSYGIRCAEPGIPGVYTKVSEFSDWVLEKVERES